MNHELTPDGIADRIIWCRENGEPIREREAEMLAKAWKRRTRDAIEAINYGIELGHANVVNAVTNQPMYHLCDA